MLRHRLVVVLTFNDGVLFRTRMFEPDYRYTLNFVDTWSVDEIVVLDITRPGKGRKENFFDVITRFARECCVPLAAGGGIRSIDDVRRFLDLGADKVVVNSGAVAHPELITGIARSYGAQCVVLSMDVRRDGDGAYQVYSDCGSAPTGLDPAAWAKRSEDMGAGEILATSVERDGALTGYDLDLCRLVADSVSVPVLIAGGAGNWGHFVAGIREGGASAVCTSNIYHFTETSIHSAKRFLSDTGISVRL